MVRVVDFRGRKTKTLTVVVVGTPGANTSQPSPIDE